MARGALRFRQSGLTRAIKAALAAGLKVERAYVEVDGRIMLGFSKPVGDQPEPKPDSKEIVL
jgi:hypothetical protein